MGAFLGSTVQSDGRRDVSIMSVPVVRANVPRRQPVATRLKEVTATSARVCPPPGDDRLWWYRLKRALGTCSDDFVNTSLIQLQSATRLPNHGICEAALNGALALIEAVGPRDEVEGALALQMAASHAAAMAVIGKLCDAPGQERRAATLGTVAARLMKTYALQVETLRRLRHGSSQTVRVEHVHVAAGGQAMVGMIHGS